jgi:two-component system, OmpR family, sensor histidine kinase MtrB
VNPLGRRVGLAGAARPRWRRRLDVTRLRPRLVLTFALVAGLASVAVAVTSYVVEREGRLGRFTDSAVDQSQFNLRLAADTFAEPPSDVQLRFFIRTLERRGSFDVVALAGERSFQTSVSLSPESVPADLREQVDAGRIAVTRRQVGSSTWTIVGGRPTPSDVSFYFFFPVDEVLADLEELRDVLAAVAALTMALSAAVGAVAARRLLRPVARARDAARMMEAGLLDTRLEVDGDDEFGELTQSFNLMAAALERMVGELREMEAVQRRFVADVSHELRTPLTALSAAADVLEAHTDGLDDHGGRAARILVVEVRRLRDLVADLMEISRLDAGVAAMQWTEVDLAIAVERAVAARGLGGEVELRLGAGAVTHADPRRIDTIVGNLVGNALEHGGPPVLVTVSVEPGEVVVEVADGGAGIAPEHLAHIFDRFYKADAARTRSAGSGLGLAIVRENVELHGGRVDVASVPGQGTRFTVRLPVLHAPPGAGSGADERSLPDGYRRATAP